MPAECRIRLVNLASCCRAAAASARPSCPCCPSAVCLFGGKTGFAIQISAFRHRKSWLERRRSSRPPLSPGATPSNVSADHAEIWSIPRYLPFHFPRLNRPLSLTSPASTTSSGIVERQEERLLPLNWATRMQEHIKKGTVNSGTTFE